MYLLSESDLNACTSELGRHQWNTTFPNLGKSSTSQGTVHDFSLSFHPSKGFHAATLHGVEKSMN